MYARFKLLMLAVVFSFTAHTPSITLTPANRCSNVEGISSSLPPGAIEFPLNPPQLSTKTQASPPGQQALLLARQGQTAQALQQIKRVTDTTQQTALTLSIIRTLAKAQQFSQAEALVRSTSDAIAQFWGIDALVTQQVQAGQLPAALKLAQTLKFQSRTAPRSFQFKLGSVDERPLMTIAKALVRSGKIPEAAQVLRSIQNVEIRTSAAASIFKTYLSLKSIPESVQIATTIDSEGMSPSAQLGIYVNQLLQAGRGQLALQVTQSIRHCWQQAVALTVVARHYRVHQQPQTALPILNQAWTGVQQLRDRLNQPGMMMAIAAEYRELGQLKSSIAVLNQVMPLLHLDPSDDPTIQLIKRQNSIRLVAQYRQAGLKDQAASLLTQLTEQTQATANDGAKVTLLRELAQEYENSGQSETAQKLRLQAEKIIRQSF